MNQQPFRPFRLTLSDGRSYNIPNHDAAWVKKDTIEIGTHIDENSLWERYVECAIMHITSIEDVSAGKAA